MKILDPPLNPPDRRMMLVNCIVNQSFYTPVTPMMVCWKCRCIQPLPPGAQSIECDFCKTITPVQYPDPRSPRSPHIPKKAAVICVSYRKSSHEFESSIEVAKKMKKLLKTSFQFSESAIVMLTEEQTDRCKPTKKNLLSYLSWLGQGCRRGDSLVFYYCGHGLRLRNYKQAEVDGYNETLCPTDFETDRIFDEEINAVIVEHLPLGVKLHAIIDSCNRNSVLDLRFLYRKEKDSEQYQWEDSSPGSHRAFKGTSGGKAISFSSSVHVPPSADTPLLSETTSAGSMTIGFIQAIEHLRKHKNGRKLTYWGILDYMQNKYIPINPTSADLKQEPLLSACGEFDVNTPFTL